MKSKYFISPFICLAVFYGAQLQADLKRLESRAASAAESKSSTQHVKDTKVQFNFSRESRQVESRNTHINENTSSQLADDLTRAYQRLNSNRNVSISTVVQNTHFTYPNITNVSSQGSLLILTQWMPGQAKTSIIVRADQVYQIQENL